MKMISNLNQRVRISVTILFLSLFSFPAFAQSPLDFFPHQVGNLWQYRLSVGHLMWTDIIDTVYTDTTSTICIGYTNIWHDTWYTPTIDKGWYSIIDSIFVYKGLNPKYNPIAVLLYKLNAQKSDVWVANYIEDSTYRYVANVFSISTACIYGKEVAIKDVRYGITTLDSPDTMWWDYRTLAEGFGMIEAQLEPMAPVYLTGAIINGVRYGYIVGVEEIENRPKEFILSQNFPNPFNPVTVIIYQLSANSNVKLRIFDLLGREIAKLVDEYQVAQSYSVKFDASRLPSGTYFYQLQTKGGVITKKMTLIK